MSIYLGNKKISSPNIGNKEIDKIYYGNTLVYQSASPYPVKGDLINMTLGNTAESGTNNLYRVLKINGTIAEVLAMYDFNNSCTFGSTSYITYLPNHSTTGQKDGVDYNTGGGVDVMLNNTFYSSLTAKAKEAIVDKTFYPEGRIITDQTSKVGNPFYFRYYLGSINGSIIGGPVYYTENPITRHVYAPTITDIVDYLGLQSSDIMYDTQLWKMFWNTDEAPSSLTYPWLCSAQLSLDIIPVSRAHAIFSNYGNIIFDRTTYAYSARPVFQIDLSKIEWSKA